MRILVILFSFFSLIVLPSVESYCQDKNSVKPIGKTFLDFTPLEYLNFLKENFKEKETIDQFGKTVPDHFPLTILPYPKDWVKKEHIPILIKLIYKTDTTRSIMSYLSSQLDIGKFSSVGREAQNLIRCFIAKKKLSGFS